MSRAKKNHDAPENPPELVSETDLSPECSGGSESAEGAARVVLGSSEPTANPLEAELLAARQRVDELARALSATVNEQKDMRARMEREKTRVIDAERGKVALALIEIGDELDRALAAAALDDPMVQGVRMIRDGLAQRLTGMGLTRIPLLGKRYDPMVAEAIDLVPVELSEEDGTVVEEIRPAFQMNEKLIREGRVRVGKYREPTSA